MNRTHARDQRYYAADAVDGPRALRNLAHEHKPWFWSVSARTRDELETVMRRAHDQMTDPRGDEGRA